MSNYILEGHTPVVCEDIIKWSKWFEQTFKESVSKRILAQTSFHNGVKISTIFLAMDHNWSGGPPILFETMIFGGHRDMYQVRYHTWDEAMEGHLEAVRLASGCSRRMLMKIFNKPNGIWIKESYRAP